MEGFGQETPYHYDFHLSSPKPGHTTGGSGRGGARRGYGAGQDRTGRRQDVSPRRQPSFEPSKASNTHVLNDSPEARTSEIPCIAVEEPSLRLTSGLSAVYPRDDGRSSFLVADQWTGPFLPL